MRGYTASHCSIAAIVIDPHSYITCCSGSCVVLILDFIELNPVPSALMLCCINGRFVDSHGMCKQVCTDELVVCEEGYGGCKHVNKSVI